MRSSFLKKFILVTQKNLINLWRNKWWTVFELLVPLLLAAPIIYALTESAGETPRPAHVFEALEVSGDVNDKDRTLHFMKQISRKWCSQSALSIAYCINTETVPSELAAQIMKHLAERYTGRGFTLTEVQSESCEKMEGLLRHDLKNESRMDCIVTKLVGGIEFSALNLTEGRFEYAIRVPNEGGADATSWRLQENWRAGNPYAGVDYSAMPNEPPYWSYAFLSFQKALNDLFLHNISETPNENIYLQRFPIPSFKENTVEKFLLFLPTMWAVFIFPTVIHAAREIAAECESGVKDFMRVMGLSSSLFFFTHAFIAFVKTSIICLACAIPISNLMASIAPSIFLLTIILYALGVVAFALFCAALLKTANSVLKMAVVLWLISVGLPYVLNATRDRVLYCVICSLNVNHAFRFAMEIMNDYCNRERYLGISRLFEASSISFSLGLALVMIIVDFVWMIALALLMDHLRSGGEGPLARVFRTYKQSQPENFEDGARALQMRQAAAFDDEIDFVRQESTADIRVEGLTKIYSETGERAVDGMSMNAHRGQVTVLLGHNGAGKSTTFNVICGLLDATEGGVHVSERPVGLCPQNNALFEKLTVSEHLWFFHGLKGATTNLDKEISDIFDWLKLGEKKNELAMNLSGGMKRKLCVSLALIGNSRVVLLDEPTAGMDPGARRDVENMLQQLKADRTILLTTHYMDEAELLGDWVYIMCKGRAVASGTTKYLKSRYGTGFVLTVVASTGMNSLEGTNISSASTKSISPEEVRSVGEQVAQIARKVLFDGIESNEVSVGEPHGRQIEVILPESRKDRLPLFFEELERMQDYEDLNAQSFGVSLNSLEQVFLKVGEMAEIPDIDGDLMNQSLNLVDGHNDRRLQGVYLWLSRLQYLLCKRFIYTLRNWPHLISQFLLPIALLLLVAYAASITSTRATNASRILDFTSVGPVKVVLQVLGSRLEEGEAYRKKLMAQPNFELIELMASQDFNETILQLPKELPALGLGAILERGKTIALFNGVGYHMAPAVLNLIANSKLAQYRSTGQITPSIHVYERWVDNGAAHQVISSDVTDLILAPLLILAFALVTSAFVTFLVEERVSQFTHQQRLTSVPMFLFWLASFVYDFLVYFLACLIFYIIFVVSGWMQGMMTYVVVMWALYFWACCPFIYAVSFIFSSPSKANTMLVVWQIISSIMALIVVSVWSLIFPSVDVDYVTTALMFVLPPYAMGAGMLNIAQHKLLSSLTTSDNIWAWGILGRPATMMGLFGVFSLILFCVLQSQFVKKFFSDLWSIRTRAFYQKSDREIEDEDIRNERQLAKDVEVDYVLKVEELYKFYGRKPAVDGLTFVVEPSQCFGLLGINGAGKTTTFDILTGVRFPTSGNAKIGSHDVSEHIAIGYCPQFDAMLLDLTGRETLRIMAALHGYENPVEKAEQVLAAVDMWKNGDKKVRHYSGGQRRKISVAIALLARTPIVILDEPTAGIDPKARRDIWTHLATVRDRPDSALLLTSHSMDECEALCTKIAIINRGKMSAIGTSQHLKSKYGNSYTLTMVLRENNAEEAQRAVLAAFPLAHIRTSGFSLTLNWEIPRKSDDRWSELWRHAGRVAAELNARDFCIIQSSLEQTFLTLAAQEDSSASRSDSQHELSPA